MSSALLIAPLAFAACSPSPVAKPPEAKASATPSAPAKQAQPVPDCPEEQLSCGKQKPVVSKGQPFENENYELRAYFPRGDRVCMGRSGDAPHGFYAEYDTATPCAEREPSPAAMRIYASFNLSHLSAEAAARDWIEHGHCKPISPSLLHRFGGAPPAIAGHPTAMCEERESDGGISIYVHVLAGRTQEVDIAFDPDKQGRAPYIEYFATLRTRPHRIDRDIPKFQTFLRRLQIGVPIKS